MNLQPREFFQDEYVISTDPARLDLAWTHDYLTNDAYWAQGISYRVFEKSTENALCFGVYHQERQIGFARVISDYATFAYLADVFISKEYRGRDLGRWLVKCILGYPELQGLRRWMLLTSDAHGLYERYGFIPVRHPEKVMEKVTLEVTSR
jgi:GNAT superfamily N-acetyltransferase